MNVKGRLVTLLFTGFAAVGHGQAAAQAAANYTPTKVNKIVELWEAGQPAYYAQIADYGREQCAALSGTNADYISVNMEHSYVDVRLLRECMEGLAAAGPTRSGHRTPAVIAVLPAFGWTEAEMRGNLWLIKQIAASGVHGMLLTHAVDPSAVRLMIESIRYPFAPIFPGYGQGQQGSGSSGFPAGIWGLAGNDYLRRSDVYGLSPEGEFVIGLKIEDTHGQESAEQLAAIPGVSFVEHGPGDTGYWYGGPGVSNTRQAELTAVEERVYTAVANAGKRFLHACSEAWLTSHPKTGVCTNPQAAEADRIRMGRRMPW